VRLINIAIISITGDVKIITREEKTSWKQKYWKI